VATVQRRPVVEGNQVSKPDQNTENREWFPATNSFVRVREPLLPQGRRGAIARFYADFAREAGKQLGLKVTAVAIKRAENIDQAIRNAEVIK
jgi:hypothetical protein